MMDDLRIPVTIDVGPVIQAELASVGLAGQPTLQDEGPPGNLPPLGEASQAELAETLVAAERLTQAPKLETQEEAAPDAPEPFFAGLFRGRTPVYGCPGCAVRGRRSVDIMWHLRSFPAHDRR